MAAKDYVPRLKKHYEDVVKPALLEEFKYANAMQVPRLEKVVVNMGVGEAVGDSKKVMAAVGDLTAITGQKPVVTRAKKAIANFQLREIGQASCRERVCQYVSLSVAGASLKKKK